MLGTQLQKMIAPWWKHRIGSYSMRVRATPKNFKPNQSEPTFKIESICAIRKDSNRIQFLNRGNPKKLKSN